MVRGVQKSVGQEQSPEAEADEDVAPAEVRRQWRPEPATADEGHQELISRDRRDLFPLGALIDLLAHTLNSPPCCLASLRRIASSKNFYVDDCESSRASHARASLHSRITV